MTRYLSNKNDGSNSSGPLPPPDFNPDGYEPDNQDSTQDNKPQRKPIIITFEDLKDPDFRKISNLLLAANLMALASVFVLQIPLALAAVISATLALILLNKMSQRKTKLALVAKEVKKPCTLTLIFSIALLVINTLSFAITNSQFAEYINQASQGLQQTQTQGQGKPMNPGESLFG